MFTTLLLTIGISSSMPIAEQIQMLSLPEQQEQISAADIQANVKREIADEIWRQYHVRWWDCWTVADAAMRNSVRYGVSVELILSVISVESAFHKEAISKTGARGVMQVMPNTAEEIAKDLGIKEYDIHDLRTNIRFGTYYLSKMHKRFDDWGLAIRSYNCGPSYTTKVITGGQYQYPSETKDYHVKVVQVWSNIQTQMPFISLASI